MIEVIQGNALHIPLPAKSVQCVVTSPPYWGLRDYGIPGQLGLERTPEEYVANMVAVFREVWRVLRDDGTLWLNLGDSYARETGNGSNGGQGKRGVMPEYDNARRIMSESRGSSDGAVGRADRAARRNGSAGIKTKDMIGIPWRVAFALQADGWYLRSDIIWHKPNPMPESVTDRPTKSHEYLFLLSKSERYYYDAEAIKEPGSMASLERISQPNFANQKGGPKDYGNGTNKNRSMRKTLENFASKQRELKKEYPKGVRAGAGNKMGRGAGWRENPDNYALMRNKRDVWTIATKPYPGAHFATFPTELVEPCILAGSQQGDVVLDPFSGTGTVGQVAALHGRDFIGVELKREYIDLAGERLHVLPVMLPLGV